VKGSPFTHWFLLKDIEYKEEEMVTKESIIYNDQKYTVEMIRKDGVTYLKTRDIANVLGISVGSRGKIPVLMDKKGSAV
jgi:predicted XRE-type DNA-binding protein